MKILFLNTHLTFRDIVVICANETCVILAYLTINLLRLLYHALYYTLVLINKRKFVFVFLDISKASDKVWHPGLFHN